MIYVENKTKILLSFRWVFNLSKNGSKMFQVKMPTSYANIFKDTHHISIYHNEELFFTEEKKAKYSNIELTQMWNENELKQIFTRYNWSAVRWFEFMWMCWIYIFGFRVLVLFFRIFRANKLLYWYNDSKLLANRTVLL